MIEQPPPAPDVPAAGCPAEKGRLLRVTRRLWAALFGDAVPPDLFHGSVGCRGVPAAREHIEQGN